MRDIDHAIQVLKEPGLRLDQVEDRERVVKDLLLDALSATMTIAEATAFSRVVRRIGLIAKPKPYGVKWATPFGYSLFSLRDGAGFSFQIHRTKKEEIFRILAAGPRSMVFLCDEGAWHEGYDESQFSAWLEYGSPCALSRFAIEPQPGDVVIVDRPGLVHWVLGCDVEEFANETTDMVARLHDQNAARRAVFTRLSQGRRAIDWPSPRREIRWSAGAIQIAPIRRPALDGGTGWSTSTASDVQASFFEVAPGGSRYLEANDQLKVLGVHTGICLLSLHEPGGAPSPEPVLTGLSAPEDAIVAVPPGFDGYLTNVTRASVARVSQQSVPAAVALA